MSKKSIDFCSLTREVLSMQVSLMSLNDSIITIANILLGVDGKDDDYEA